MKKTLLTIAATVAITTSAQADIQKVYTSGHSQSGIIKAVETMVQKPTNKSDSLIVVQSSTKCKYGWGVYGPIDYALQVEAKDKKFRVSVKNAKGELGVNFWSMAPKFVKNCSKLVDADVDKFAQSINNWSDF